MFDIDKDLLKLNKAEPMPFYNKQKYKITIEKSGTWILPIPDILYSEATGRPFAHCSQCGLELLENGAGYIIAKSVLQNLTYKSSETTMEYALCFQCHQTLWNSFSTETIRQLEQFLERSVDFPMRNQRLQQRKKTLHDWIGTCLVTGAALETCEFYQLNALAIGPTLIFEDLPYALSWEALQTEEQLFSTSSWNTWCAYFEKHFGYPALIRDILQK